MELAGRLGWWREKVYDRDFARARLRVFDDDPKHTLGLLSSQL